MSPSPLDRFPLIRTGSPEMMKEVVVRDYGALAFDLPSGADGFFGKSNCFKIKDIEMKYVWAAQDALGIPRRPKSL